MNVPDYYKPWPDEPSFSDMEPDLYDELEVTKFKENEAWNDTNTDLQQD